MSTLSPSTVSLTLGLLRPHQRRWSPTPPLSVFSEVTPLFNSEFDPVSRPSYCNVKERDLETRPCSRHTHIISRMDVRSAAYPLSVVGPLQSRWKDIHSFASESLRVQAETYNDDSEGPEGGHRTRQELETGRNKPENSDSLPWSSVEIRLRRYYKVTPVPSRDTKDV